jgi:large subunit ribosomal protein L25
MSRATLPNQYVQLAKQLHPRLLRFLAKYPPSQILPASTRANTTATADGAVANPFLPHKHPVTGRWQDPQYSLRRQAELVKLAREQGVEELLPFTSKGTEERIRKRVEEGLRVKGTGVGQRVKGHLHERMLAPKYVLLSCRVSVSCLLARVLANHVCASTGWRRDVRPSWACRNWSENGARFVLLFTTATSLETFSC